MIYDSKIYEMGIVEAFEKAVDIFSNRIAIRDENGELSYKELSEAVNDKARGLIDLAEWHQNICVAMDLPKDRMAIIMMLAIYKAGGILLPIPIDCPIHRVESIIRQTQAEIMITDKNVFFNIKSVNPTRIQSSVLKQSAEAMINNRNEALAYIMFTSGSTGEPKGIMVNQRSVINIACSCYKRFFGWPDEKTFSDLQDANNESMVIGILADFSFDPSMVQLFIGLFFGNCVVPVPDVIKRSQWKLSGYLSQMKVECVDITPSHLKHILSFYDNNRADMYFPRCVVSVGEPLTIEFMKWLKEFNVTERVVNAYGPTEVCVYCNAKEYKVSECEELREITVGKALEGYEVYVLDKEGKEVEPGKIGEICVASPYLSCGYIGKDELTKKSFVKFPSISSYMIYRTNDLGYKDANGEIVCKGRADDQVKIAGHRIETGEIEEIIKAHTDVKNIKVLVSQEQEEKKLITFYAGKKQTDKYFVELLKEYLPAAMMPKTYINIEQFPLNQNGKVDRKKLLELHGKIKSVNEDNSVEHIVSEILGLQDITLEDNFFEKGATSLDMFLFNTKIYNLYGVLMDNEKLLACETIGDIKNLINKLMLEKSVGIDLNSKASVLCNEFICQVIRSELRVEKTQSTKETLPPNNVIFKLQFTKFLDEGIVEKALKILTKRHRILRSCYVYHDEKVYLESFEQNHIDFKYFDSEQEFELLHEIRNFKYNEAPLFQVLLIDKDNAVQDLYFNFHHGIADQISVEIFINEFLRLCKGYELPENKIDYFEYYDRYIKYDKEKTRDFWRGYLQQRSKSVGFKGSGINRRMKVTGYEKYDTCKVVIGEADFAKINLQLHKFKLNSFSFFSLVLAYTLYKESGQNDLIIGSVLHGRSNHILGASNVIGMLAQLLPVRFVFDATASVPDMLVNAKRNIEEVLEHQNIGLYDIYLMQTFEERIKGEYFKIIINYNEGLRIDKDVLEGNLECEELGANIGYVPLYFYICKEEAAYRITVKYATSIYGAEDIDVIMRSLMKNINLFVQ